MMLAVLQQGQAKRSRFAAAGGGAYQHVAPLQNRRNRSSLNRRGRGKTMGEGADQSELAKRHGVRSRRGAGETILILICGKGDARLLGAIVPMAWNRRQSAVYSQVNNFSGVRNLESTNRAVFVAGCAIGAGGAGADCRGSQFHGADAADGASF
jgi:hypothetical protein